MLSDFRVVHQEALDGLLTQIIGSLMAAGAVRLWLKTGCEFQGGLKMCLEKARAQVERLAQERERPDPGVTRRERAARERVAREREERVREALSYLPRAQAKKERQLHTKATDQRPKITAGIHHRPPGNGDEDAGWRLPASLQCRTGHRLRQWDHRRSSPRRVRMHMEEQLVRRTGRHPESYLMDGGFAKDITLWSNEE